MCNFDKIQWIIENVDMIIIKPLQKKQTACFKKRIKSYAV